MTRLSGASPNPLTMLRDRLRGRRTQFYIDLTYGLAFIASFGYLVFVAMDPRVATFVGGLIVGYFLHVWEKMVTYERILAEEVSQRAEEQVSTEVDRQVGERVEAEVDDQIGDVDERIEDEVATEVGDVDEKIEEEVTSEVKERVEEEIDGRRVAGADGDGGS